MSIPATARPTIDRDTCAALDAADPLAGFRARFCLPEGIVYLDGNSLGALLRDTAAHVQHVITHEWGTGLIRSWNDAEWFAKPQSVGDLIAPIIGAGPGQVFLGDSTSASLFQVAAAATRLRPGRRVIVAERGNFPTDLYVLESVQELLGGGVPLERRLIADDGPTLDDVLDDDVAIVVLTHVDYRTGRMHDMAEVTRKVHEVGAIIVWDLCHSVGAVPVDLIGDVRLAPHWAVEVVTPRECARRGSQVSLRVSDGYEIMQALIERGVIGDFRAPDLIRFGFTPLYTSYVDVWDAVDTLENVLDTGLWREPRFVRRRLVT